MDEQQDSYKPLFHGRMLLFVFALFLGAFFGALLFCQNLAAAGKKNYIAGTVIVAILYNYFGLRLLTTAGITDSFLRLFIPNMVAAGILAGPYWHFELGAAGPYNTRNILWPLLAIVVVYGLFITLNIIFPGRVGRRAKMKRQVIEKRGARVTQGSPCPRKSFLSTKCFIS